MKSCASCVYSTSTLEQGLDVLSCSKAEAVVGIEGFGTSVGSSRSLMTIAMEELASDCPSFDDSGSLLTTKVFLNVRGSKIKTPSTQEGTCYGCSNLEVIHVGDVGTSPRKEIKVCKSSGLLIQDVTVSSSTCGTFHLGVSSYVKAKDATFGGIEGYFPWLDDVSDSDYLYSRIASIEGKKTWEKEEEVTPPPYVEVKVGPNWAKPKASISFQNPQDYSSDMPVTKEYEGIIKAWRIISIGEGSKRKGVYLPIYEPSYFTEAERLNIPQLGDSNHPELYKDGSGILEAFTTESYMEGNPLCLVGEPGSGKTEAARYIAYWTQSPFTHLTITEESLADQFCGTVRFDPVKGTHFVWGRLPLAISRPGVVLSDEVNTGPDSILQMYRSLTSSSKTIFLEDEEDVSKRTVKQHPDCFHMLALNPSWDSRNLGTRELADPDVQRLSFMWLEEPGEADIKEIILSNLEVRGLKITVEELEGMMSVRRDIKEMSRSGALPFSWSIRQDIKVAIKLAYYSAGTAYKRSLLDFCPPDSASAVMKSVQSVFGFTD